ncbi:MAG: cell division topological specificity factor MinE [Pseudanabaenaceae cyanobacterium]
MLLSISEFIERFFAGKPNQASGSKVKQRLKFILAHDRAALPPQLFEAMRQEIMAVVSKYLEIDQDNLDIRLESDHRLTALVANLPIKAVKQEEQVEITVPPLDIDAEHIDGIDGGNPHPPTP